MRQRAIYIHQKPGWPAFTWDHETIAPLLASVRYRQGKVLGLMEGMGFHLQSEATLHTLTEDVLKTSEIEGEVLNKQQVRSSIARKLGMDIAGLVPADRHVDGVVEMMLDATRKYKEPLSRERLFNWHAALFPTARSGMQKITVAAWRTNTKDDPMQVVSGAMGKEKVHYQAPDSELLEGEMKKFLSWFNKRDNLDAVLKAAIAHLWFVTIHPFDDGNGRIARAIADMQLARADETMQRFYSMSAQIRNERNAYYKILEITQQGTLDITRWLQWFLQCLQTALTTTNHALAGVIRKARFWEAHAKTVFNQRQVLLLNKILDGFDGKVTTSKWAKIAKSSPDTALRDIQDLLERNVLVKEGSGGRSTSYQLASD